MTSCHSTLFPAGCPAGIPACRSRTASLQSATVRIVAQKRRIPTHFLIHFNDLALDGRHHLGGLAVAMQGDGSLPLPDTLSSFREFDLGDGAGESGGRLIGFGARDVTSFAL